MASKRGRNWATRQDEDFQKFLKSKAVLNYETGQVDFNDVYVSLYVTIGWRSNSIAVPYSHLVWFLSRGEWPTDGKNIDHVNDIPFDNRPDNLQELTKEANNEKRRNRKVYSNYGSGKYGYGINIILNKKKKIYEASRYLSRGETKTRKTVREWIGSGKTLEEAEKVVKRYIANGLKRLRIEIDLDELFE